MCYDAFTVPESRLIFPLELQHDLCLITWSNPPVMITPEDLPRLQDRFADPQYNSERPTHLCDAYVNGEEPSGRA